MNILVIAVLIPALMFLPFLLSEEAYAYKLTDKEIKIEVYFYRDVNTNIPQMIADFDSGLIEQNIFTVIEPVAVGQFTIDDIIADWDLIIDFDTGLYKLNINPKIIEVNISNGVPQPTIIDALVNDGRDQVKQWLTNYGITRYDWYLYYDGGLQIIDETPENFSFKTSDQLSTHDNIRTTVDNPALSGTLTIVKNIITDRDGDAFQFTSTFGDFDVVAITSQGSVTFENLDKRIIHSVQELPKNGWVLDSATCDNGQTIDNIILGAAPVTCTFTNTFVGG